MANYVLSYAFSDQVFHAYARAAMSRLREAASAIAKRIAARNAARNSGERRRRAIFGGLKSLDRRRRDIGPVRDIGLA